MWSVHSCDGMSYPHKRRIHQIVWLSTGGHIWCRLLHDDASCHKNASVSVVHMFSRSLSIQKRQECFHGQDITRPVPLQRRRTESKRVITPCHEFVSNLPSQCFRRETERPAARRWDRLTEQNGSFLFLIREFPCSILHPLYSSLIARKITV
jgi:hypothetical protein